MEIVDSYPKAPCTFIAETYASKGSLYMYFAAYAYMGTWSLRVRRRVQVQGVTRLCETLRPILRCQTGVLIACFGSS